MGKPGGFFKKLKAKNKKEANKKRRGTTGASKEDRARKHNQDVDYYAAQRQLHELESLSASSSDVDSTDSEAEMASTALGRLRQSLGIAANGAAHNASEQYLDDEDALPPGSSSEDEEEELDEGNEEGEESDLGEELEEGDLMDEEGDFDDEAEEEEESSEPLDEGDMSEQDAEVDSDAEEEEEADHDEDEYQSDEELDRKALARERKTFLLPSFEWKSTKAATVRGIVDEQDPWFNKYHSGQCAAADESQLAAAATSDSSALPWKLRVSTKAKTNLNALRKASTKKNAMNSKPTFIHESLWDKWCAYRSKTHPDAPALSPSEVRYLEVLQTYADVLDTTRDFDVGPQKMELYCLHLLNHWFKTKSVCTVHDSLRLDKADGGNTKEGKKTKKRSREGQQQQEQEEDEEEYRDRGFGKTRLMLLLPLRNIARRYVMLLVDILQANPQHCRKLAQFDSDFSEMEEAVDSHFKRRPLDYRRQFEGNIDDSFCFGLSIQADRLHVYSHVLNSDIIICSPIGLRKRLEKAGDLLVAMSSIELCIIDEAHVLLMQNWDHVRSTLEQLNQKPTETTSGLSDLSRVFGWAIEGKSELQRQTIVCSDVGNSVLTSTFRSFKNNSGRIVVEHLSYDGVLSNVTASLRQHFLRFEADSPQSLEEDRFRYFVDEIYHRKIFPLMERNVRVILFLPSYFDFVRVRNFLFKECREMYGCISEYTGVKEQRRVLGQFSDLERPLLLMTERFYFLKRYFVKLGEVLCFYSPPVFAKFYPHLVSKLTTTSPNASVMTLFSRYDAVELARVIGTQRATQCFEREASAFSFVTTA